MNVEYFERGFFDRMDQLEKLGSLTPKFTMVALSTIPKFKPFAQAAPTPDLLVGFELVKKWKLRKMILEQIQAVRARGIKAVESGSSMVIPPSRPPSFSPLGESRTRHPVKFVEPPSATQLFPIPSSTQLLPTI